MRIDNQPLRVRTRYIPAVELGVVGRSEPYILWPQPFRPPITPLTRWPWIHQRTLNQLDQHRWHTQRVIDEEMLGAGNANNRIGELGSLCRIGKVGNPQDS